MFYRNATHLRPHIAMRQAHHGILPKSILLVISSNPKTGHTEGIIFTKFSDRVNGTKKKSSLLHNLAFKPPPHPSPTQKLHRLHAGDSLKQELLGRMPWGRTQKLETAQ